MLRIQTFLIFSIHLFTKLIGFMTLLPSMLALFICTTYFSCWKPNGDAWRWVAVAIAGVILLVPYGRIKNAKTLRIYFIILTFITLSGILSALPSILSGGESRSFFSFGTHLGPAVLLANIYLCYRHYRHLLQNA